MGFGEEEGKEEQLLSPSSSVQSSILGLRDKHQKELDNLTVTTQPLKTCKFFILAILQWLQQQTGHVSMKKFLFALISILAVGCGIMITAFCKPDEEYFQEFYNYLQFGMWWLALGVASSIGLGSGLHTFVLYLGPHIALFSMKCVQCGRIDVKAAPYDTIQFRKGPSWLDKDCSDYGPSLYSLPGSRVPLSSILHQVQLEAMLWGLGTALGELPPYFISRAAYLSGRKLELMEDVDISSKDNGGGIENHLNQMKKWLLQHSEHLNFFTILVLASVPNPLFDLAGIMCGQLGIPFWKFFTATVIGKAIIKTHIQTCFIISVCNNQLLDLVENELLRVLSLVPGVASILPKLIAKLHFVREKYMEASPRVPSNAKVKGWDLSLGSVWNTVVLLILVNFMMKTINAIAQGFMKEQHEKEMMAHQDDVSTQ
ncbi:hypothetical protein M9H77_27601 [Catharanthus roseus]|uniref:Uncharacterized protein n=1 Tax=Catharanthus roseus TaxID=4058 RepID=A0ACC0AH95_CATRO|nr:hypothetical protein M9H77_27601 [Catharanthus roseus]